MIIKAINNIAEFNGLILILLVFEIYFRMIKLNLFTLFII